VVSSNYGDNGLGRYPSKPSGPYGQSLLIYIYKGWGRLYHHLSFEVGVGSSCFFWARWSSARSLFLSLSACCEYKCYCCRLLLFVNEYLGLMLGLMFSFVMHLLMMLFLSTKKLNEITLWDSLTDLVTWDLNSKGAFTVSSYYLILLSDAPISAFSLVHFGSSLG